MNPSKSQIKAVVYDEVGREFEKREGDALKDSERQHGARDALKLAAQRVGELGNHIREEMKEGVIEELAGDPLKVEAYAMKWLKRAVGVCDNLATTAEVARVHATGRAKGLADAKEHALKLLRAENSVMEAYRKAMESPDGEDLDGRSLDGHPGLPMKARRRAEDEADEVGKEPSEKPEKAKSKAKAKTPAKKRLRDPKKKR